MFVLCLFFFQAKAKSTQLIDSTLIVSLQVLPGDAICYLLRQHRCYREVGVITDSDTAAELFLLHENNRLRRIEAKQEKSKLQIRGNFNFNLMKLFDLEFTILFTFNFYPNMVHWVLVLYIDIYTYINQCKLQNLVEEFSFFCQYGAALFQNFENK